MSSELCHGSPGPVTLLCLPRRQLPVTDAFGVSNVDPYQDIICENVARRPCWETLPWETQKSTH